MIKTYLSIALSLLSAASLRAQSEPGSSPAAGEAKPATVHDAAHPADTANPPPIAAAPKTAADTGAQPQIDKNPPPIDPKNMDTSVNPGDDFYQYANGSWLKNNPVPPEYSRWGSFNELVEKNNDALHEIAEQSRRPRPGRREQTEAGESRHRRHAEGGRLLRQRDERR